MGAYNTVRGPAVCPSCNTPSEVVAQFKYGLCAQLSYSVGDVIGWNEYMRSPGHVRVVVDAVAESRCPRCGFDEWELYVFVDHEQIVELRTATGEYSFIGQGETFIVLPIADSHRNENDE
jgi:hypothetical protein